MSAITPYRYIKRLQLSFSMYVFNLRACRQLLQQAS